MWGPGAVNVWGGTLIEYIVLAWQGREGAQWVHCGEKLQWPQVPNGSSWPYNRALVILYKDNGSFQHWPPASKEHCHSCVIICKTFVMSRLNQSLSPKISLCSPQFPLWRLLLLCMFCLTGYELFIALSVSSSGDDVLILIHSFISVSFCEMHKLC